MDIKSESGEVLYNADKVRKIAGLPPAKKLSESKMKRALEIIEEIGEKHGVDFKDADGDAAKEAMLACYARGFKDANSGK